CSPRHLFLSARHQPSHVFGLTTFSCWRRGTNAAMVTGAVVARSDRGSDRERIDMKMRAAPLEVFVLALLASTPTAALAQAANARSCAASEYRQFDFWLGDWDLFEMGSTNSTA